MSVLIKNGRLVNASEDFVADLYIENETISAIGKNLNYTADKVIDASGKLVFPGGIDPHVHLDMPLWEHIRAMITKQEPELLCLVGRLQLSISFFKLRAILYEMR